MKNKVLGSLVLLAVLTVPTQVIVAQHASNELRKTQAALTACNAMLGNTIAKVMSAMPKLKPEQQKQVRQWVQSLESEVRALDDWVSDLDSAIDKN